MRTITGNDSATVRHLEDDDLISYLDGELLPDEQQRARVHLEKCWDCRSRLNLTQSSVENFIRFRQETLLPRELPPSGPAQDLFRRRLSAHISASQVKPRLSFGLTRVRSTLKHFAADRFTFLTSPIAIRAYVFLLVAAVIGVVALKSNRVTIVSANELIQRATEAQTSRISATAQPVVHQKLLVKAKSQTREESVNWEVWHDMQNWRFRSYVTNQTTGADVLNDLSRVFEANQMDPQRPLSASSYQAWRSSLPGKQEDVAKIKLADGAEAMTLRTLPAGAVSEGQIAEATFTVRSADWHPIEQKLIVKTANGSTDYELLETHSEVISLNQVDPAIFGSAQPTVAKAGTKASPSLSPNANVEPTRPSLNTVAPVASAELEVEVLQLLHQANADLGEQITATKGADGLLHVTGLVDTAERKAEIMRALQPVANDPACRIEIQTVAEAVAKQRQKRIGSRGTPAPITEQNIESGNETIAAAPELRRHLGSDDEVRQFSARMISQTHRAMQHIYAIKRLISQFSSDELRTLSPEAKNKWLELIRGHARAYQTEAQTMRAALRPIFFPNDSEGTAGSAVEITDDASLVRGVEKMISLAAANDAVIRSAFATSSDRSATSAVGSVQFRRSLNDAQTLAGRIANYR